MCWRSRTEVSRMSVIEVLVEDLIGKPLDWAVSQIEGYTLTTDGISQLVKKDDELLILGASGAIGYSPSTDWNILGPLIKKNEIVIGNHASGNPKREGQFWGSAHCFISGTRFETYAGVEVAACRAIVALHRGKSVMVPAQLMPSTSH